MKNIILLLAILPMFAIGQGVYIKSDTSTFQNGDTLTIDYYLQSWTVDFNSQVMRWNIELDRTFISGDNTLTNNRVNTYGMTMSDTLTIGGNNYTTPQIYNVIFDTGDLPAVKIVGSALIEKYPLRKFSK